jgi:hypothetical protein
MTAIRSHVTVTRRPTGLSGLAAVAAALLPAFLLLPADATPTAVGVGISLLLLAVGDALRDRGHTVLAGAVFVLAGGVALAAVGYGVAAVSRPETIVRVAVTAAGVLCVAGSVVPLRGNGSRRLLTVGTALLLLSVLGAAVLHTTSFSPLVVSGTLVVVSYDLGEHAVGLGEQLGRDAATTPVELSHGAATLAVAAVAVVAVGVASSLGDDGLSLSGLLLLLVALVGLALALHD